MKTIILIVALFGVAMAHDEKDTGVKTVIQWPQNKDSNAGAVVAIAYDDVGEGSCIVKFPTMVALFHTINANIVPGENSSPAEGRYQVIASADRMNAINETNVNALILFDRDAIFNISDITFTCDPKSGAELSIYSFPQDILQKEVSSSVHYSPGFHQGDVLTITLPQPVTRFNITRMDMNYDVSAEGNTYIISGFKNKAGIDDMKEVYFSFDYLPSDDSVIWFSAAAVTVNVQKIEPTDKDE